MTSLRAFIAVEIPRSIQQAIHASAADLRGALAPGLVRWAAVENLHLTLKFLGDISPANVDLLSNMLTTEAARCAPFPMRVSGLGSFPTPKRARVIWIGIHAPAALESLAHGIETACVRLGYEAEERPFSPHLTIGRVKQPVPAAAQADLRAALERTRVGDLGVANVEAVHLFKSDLKPSGAEYTCLFSAPLKTLDADERGKTRN
ncbi:MAG: RNA 2',3'-cyclic phosphodiesterase [Chloroflexota bacterium]